MRRKLAAGNWKMHGTGADLSELEALVAAHSAPTIDIVICTPATLIHRAAQVCAGGPITIGAQDCHPAETGAHTGDVSAPMLREAGARHVILGHSERRADHGETDAQIRAKITAAAAAGLSPILCVGETLADREAGQTLDVIATQLSGSLPEVPPAGLVLAYEPVWAIGTGHVASTDQIEEVHRALRAALVEHYGEAVAERVPLLYGGSVKQANAAEIFAVANVDGALVGGASLRAADFAPIIAALASA